jgi:hypothetical protein
LLFLNAQDLFAQKPKTIIVENADFQEINENEIPGALLLTGNVKVNHDGVVLTCNLISKQQICRIQW